MFTIIRVADPADLPGLTTLIERYWEFERIKGFDPVHIGALLTDFFHTPDRGQIWVAREGDRTVGYLLAVYLFSLEHGGLMAEIDELFVIPEKRSLKIGAELLDAATAAMAQRGMKCIQLQLGTQNVQGRRFYEQHGFDEISKYTLLYKSLRLG